MLIGYARVSTKDQDSALQEEAFLKAGAACIFIEKASGTKEDRPKLAKMPDMARKDDVISSGISIDWRVRSAISSKLRRQRKITATRL